MLPLSPALKNSLAEATERYEAARDDEALEYLAKRGIGHELAADFRIGVVRDPCRGHEQFRGRLALPFLGPDNTVCGMRFRDIVGDPGPKYLGIPGVPTRLYNVRCLLDVSLSAVCITEGEIDAISLAAAGIDGAVGVCGADNWKRHHPRVFAGFAKVYVIGDGDEAGRKFARKVSGSIQSAIEVPMPDGQDVNSILVAGGPEAVREMVGI